MKKVIFVCLLTLSVCLSDTNVNPVNSSKSDNATAAATSPAAATSTLSAADPSTTVPTDSKNETKPQEPVKPNETKPQDTVKSTPKPTNVTPAPEKNATDTKATDDKNKATTTVKPTEQGTTKPTAAPATEKSTTLKPTATTVQPHTLQARGFDGASFVGGIILTLGLLAIGFMGFKYYKAQTERNYHTL